MDILYFLTFFERGSLVFTVEGAGFFPIDAVRVEDLWVLRTLAYYSPFHFLPPLGILLRVAFEAGLRSL